MARTDVLSPLHAERQKYTPKLPRIFQENIQHVGLQETADAAQEKPDPRIAKLLPNSSGQPALECTTVKDNGITRQLTVGVILSGGQAPGGHSVICGLHDALRSGNKKSKIIGFIGGPSGLLERRYRDLTDEVINRYRGSGGFDMIGSGRTKLESKEQFDQVQAISQNLGLDAIVVIGGDDSNTNAALMAEYFMEQKCDTAVVGVPKTIDGDLKNPYIPISFGFDTATKTYSELIGNICRDAKSARKYWHFVKLMGRSASHIALECALQTHPNICVISEEVAARQLTLRALVDELAEIIVRRGQAGANFGVALIPEGLIEFIPEIGKLIGALNELLVERGEYFSSLRTFEEQAEFINRKLSVELSYVFSSLPNPIQRQLLLNRDPHGNVQVSRIDTEQLLLDMITVTLRQMPKSKREGVKFSAQHHFLGYEGRCAFPTNFDTDYCYALGHSAALLVTARKSGYMAAVHNISATDRGTWSAGAVPITSMMTVERRSGSDKGVIAKGLVDLKGPAFNLFTSQRQNWAIEDAYRYPGAIQYFGPAELCDAPPLTVQLEKQ